MSKEEDADFFGDDDNDDEVFDQNSGLITEGIENAERRSELKECASHLSRIPEEDNSIHEPTLVNPVYSCQGDFRFDESGDEDDARMQPESSKISLANPRENIAHDRSKTFYAQEMNFSAGNVSKANLLKVHDSTVQYQMGLNDSRARNATFADKSKIDYSRNSESTFRHTSQSNVSKRMIDCAAQGPSKNMEQTYYDENLAASSFKCGDAALDLINKDGEKLRQTQALRLPSQTSFGSPSGGFGFDKSKTDFPNQTAVNRTVVDSFRCHAEVSHKVMDSSQVSVAAGQKRADSTQVPCDPDLVKAHCSKSLGSASQKSQSKSEPKQGVTCNIDDKVVPSSFSLPKENAPTFLLNTSRGSHSPPLLDVDKPCMYFGFRQLQYESMDVLNLNGLVDCGLIIRCRLKPLKNEAFRILYKADTKQKIKAFGTHSVYISFCPRLAVRYKATLHIDCLSQKNESAEYTCQLLGFGGQAMVHPFLNPVSIKSRRDLVMSAGGRFNLIPKSINKFSFMLENKGTRDAFASVILQDVNGDEIPTENAFVQPANLLLDKSSQSSKKIEVRMFVQNAIGSRRNSFASNASSRISSAVNNTTGSALPTAFRILVLWGEERQRQRLKMLERRKREKFFFLNRHFTVTRYEAEQANWDDATDELLSKEDYRMFEGYLRVTVIEVLDKRYSRSIQENAFKSRPASATGNTVIELEPDNTNNFGRDSILSSILE